MVKALPSSALFGKEFVPQAIIDRPLSFFADKLHLSVFKGHDDLDEYEAAAVEVGDGMIIELKHQSGYPNDTTTIYLPYGIDDLAKITLVISVIVQEFGIPRGWITWQRADDPSL
ncbi:MAG TPA: hypothetical protein VKQ73_16345 [Stellaceae bacterium]|nr:hypothetical protein [Stellaceae bacterium]